MVFSPIWLKDIAKEMRFMSMEGTLVQKQAYR